MKINKDSLISALDDFCKYGVIKKTDKGYIETELSKRIDKLNPREAFILGINKAENKIRQQSLADRKQDILDICNKIKNKLDVFDKLEPRRFHCDACHDWSMELIDELANTKIAEIDTLIKSNGEEDE